MDKCPKCGADLERRFERKGKHHGIQHYFCPNKECGWGTAEMECDEAEIDRRLERMDR